MLPDCRNQDAIFSIPKFNIDKKEVEAFTDELKGFHEEFKDCFSRSESRDNFFRYTAGQLSKLEKKSIEPIALNIQGGKVRSMQKFISDVIWDEDKLLIKYHHNLNDDMGNCNGVLIFDESGFAKKGNDSAGVAKQYCGNLGKVENCQVGVFAAYASPTGYALLDKRLFIPEKWFTEDYETKRNKCNIPENIEFKTKPQLAVEMFHDLQEQNLLPYKYVLADSLYGNSPEFIEAIEEHEDLTYFVSIPSDTQCWLEKPITIKKEYKYKGKVQTKKTLEKGEKKSISFETLAKNINNYFWYRRKVSEGTKGPIEYEFMKRRVVISKNGLPQKTVWLIIKRTLGRNPTYNYYISNAAENTKLNIFVWLSGLRWAIEQCFEETKSELGMDQYEVRKYHGWNHHILTCMLSHFFLWHLKIRLGKKSSVYYYIAA
jgi:SRSO17 transposase